ncbi:MAG: S8 family serine peptidase [Candidatus Melainabacteria bacterium]|jgi:hypothetical protein|nr:S8 family serine peptidase [Candidatus Melainabacteria bacterium]
MPFFITIFKRLVLILVLLINIGFLINPVEAEIETEEFETKELIIKYKFKQEVVNESEAEFIDQFATKFKLQDDLSQGLFSRFKKKKHAKFRKLRKLNKLKLRSQLALLKLDKVASKSELRRLVRKLNSSHFADTDYEIEAVYPNYLYETTTTVSNDPLSHNQWSHDFIKPEQLWSITKGEGITVAVIDTGVDYTHQDLAANIWNNTDEIPGNRIDDDNNGYVDDVIGWDFVVGAGSNCAFGEDCGRSDNDPSDKNGHGTHVAGIIGAVQNNAIGISGIAPEVKIMPLRAGYSTGSSAFLKTSDIIDAISYAINNDADVINMSFAGGELSALHDVLRLADSLGIVLVAAAGNNSTSQLMYPAAFPEVISVGAIANNTSKLSFSNYGDWVDVVAPGSWIFSTIPGNAYDYKSGTSMSAPLVAGVAALIKAKSKLQDLDGKTIKARILASSVETLFRRYRETGETIGGLSAEIQFPLEVDDILMQANAVVGDEVDIHAKVSDPGVIAYEWNSDIDGFLGDQEDIVVNNLVEGSHAISVRVKNIQGEWSEPVFRILNVTNTRIISPAVFDTLHFKINRRNRKLYAGLGGRERRKQVQAYKWISNVDGTVGRRRGLNLSNLSSGFHKVSLLIQDRAGNWSEAKQKVISVGS